MPSNPLDKGLITGSFYDIDYNRYDDDRATLHDLNGSQALVAFSALLTKFEEQMEEAKMRCEDDEDDTSLGEYISLKSVVEQMRSYIQSMIRNEYSKSHLDSMLKGSPGFDTYKRMPQRGRY